METVDTPVLTLTGAGGGRGGPRHGSDGHLPCSLRCGRGGRGDTTSQREESGGEDGPAIPARLDHAGAAGRAGEGDGKPPD